MSEVCFSGFSAADFPAGVSLRAGKVRDIIDTGEELVITVTDRISAFDRVLAVIPLKGEILSRLSLWWFDKTKDVCPNHIEKRLSARTTVVRKVNIIPVEVIVRGYLTGSAWRDYSAGRRVSGLELPPGMRKNQKFDTPLVTPSTKESEGHDEPVSGKEIVSRGIVPADVWNQVHEKAVALFRRGAEIAAARGLILVDTKYEFGLAPEGGLILADEAHTPDSSRYWYAGGYEEIFRAGGEQRQLDKEFFRNWLAARGFTGDGDAPVIPDSVREAVSLRYVESFEAITGEKFTRKAFPFEAEREIVKIYISRNT
jgi:phosphoribosylaminoimidazole-succinocarboxamide synthase